ncbi:DUF4168 domain-containing protein [Ectothiorhodospira mobilis]|uniref:DUF4168 domain-containing protein n=1 Tax=Ectothiorhodospira mobilis TaxID=195064 RepID=UPI001EE79D2B|nr:DUF4168 domain-containing protein [Ectothiorhodospira mobilis]MCG5535297.1 DUF4168 domain-containing protein [Ectothiorhodospira mobilis]
MIHRKTTLTMALAALLTTGTTSVMAQQGPGAAPGQGPGGAPEQGQGAAPGQGQGGAPGQGTQGAPAGAPPAPDVELTDSLVDDFVEAFAEVRKIEQDFAGELEDTQDPEKAQSLHQEAQEKMVEAVESTGMDVQKYNDVAMALQNDPDRLEEVIERAEEKE